MSEQKPRSKKTMKAPEPIEVIVQDVVMHEKVIAEYRHEWKWWYGTKLFKVYHPTFKETLEPEKALADSKYMPYRWVMKLGKVLGSFNPGQEA